MSEISRITDHLTCVGASAMELGAFTVFLYMIKAREYLWELVEMVTGARLTVSYGRVGGVKADLPDGFAERARRRLAGDTPSLAEADALLTRNRIFVDRMSGTGKISAEDAISYGITGPFLRATGVDYDVRKDCPYAVYDRLEFDVPVGTEGTTSIATWSGWRRWSSRCGSSSRRCGTFPPGPFQVNPDDRAPDTGCGDGGSGQGRKHLGHRRYARRDRSDARRLGQAAAPRTSLQTRSGCSFLPRKTRTAISRG